jgi:GntR family transcriptional regulator
MRGILRVDPADGAPIWRQIEEGVRRLVASRSLAAGAAVPSVRDLAKELRVNPATVAKAYQRLVEGGHLVVKRGEGTFVAEAPPTLKTRDRGRLLAEGALRFASLAVTSGAERNEAQGALDQAWDDIQGHGKGGAR